MKHTYRINLARFRAWLPTLAVALAGAATCSATSYTGAFTSDDQLFQTTWSTSQAATFMAYTNSYATGGFVPVISLFDQATGSYITLDGGSASCSNGRTADPSTGMCDDSYLSTHVDAGTYRVVLSQFYNLPNGDYSAGFSESGMGNFTAQACGTSGSFWQVDASPCVQRTGSYSLQIASSQAPEPATGLLILPVAGILLAAFRRQQARASSRS